MTGVPRLYHLPVPAAQAGTTAVALPEGDGGRRVKAVVPAATVQRGDGKAERSAQWQGSKARETVDDGARRGSGGAAALRGGEASGGHFIDFSRLTAMPFMVQVLGQQVAARGQATPQTSLTGHRDAALLGSDIYRRAGGEPEVLPDGATFVRLAV